VRIFTTRFKKSLYITLRLASSAKSNARITTPREKKLVVLLINQKDYEHRALKLA